MLLSIIIPVHNKIRYIPRLFNSLSRQKDKTNIEIIIIDDCCEDKSIEEIHKYDKELNIKYLTSNYKNPGLTRNIGIQQAQGEWVTFIDADDYIEDTAFSTIKSLLYIYQNTIITEISTPVYMLENNNKNKMNKEVEVSYLHGKIYRKEMLKKYNIIFPNFLRTHEDNYFNILTYTISNNNNAFVYSDNAFYVYCVNDDSMVQKTDTLENHYYLEVNLHEYLLSQHEAFKKLIKLYPNKKDNLYDKVLSNILYSYHYFQAFLYRYGMDTVINIPQYYSILKEIEKTYNITGQDIYLWAYEDAERYEQIKAEVEELTGKYIEFHSLPYFFNWLEEYVFDLS